MTYYHENKLRRSQLCLKITPDFVQEIVMISTFLVGFPRAFKVSDVFGAAKYVS